MISLPLPPETERLIEQFSEKEKESLSLFIQAFVKRVKSVTLANISLPGPALTADDLEKLAADMEADNNFLNEAESEAYLAQLKATWNKPKA